MNAYNSADYTFLGLCNHGKPLGLVESLVYLVGLVNSTEHEVTDIKKATNLLIYLFDSEEQKQDVFSLLSMEADFLPEGYQTQTPVMLAKGWSPIGAMLERGFNPIVLNREMKYKATATGIWEAQVVGNVRRIEDCRTAEDLFWAIFSEASRRANERKLRISILAKPGWSYETGVHSLPKWSDDEVARADKILWKRTPECP